MFLLYNECYIKYINVLKRWLFDVEYIFKTQGDSYKMKGVNIDSTFTLKLRNLQI